MVLTARTTLQVVYTNIPEVLSDAVVIHTIIPSQAKVKGHKMTVT